MRRRMKMKNKESFVKGGCTAWVVCILAMMMVGCKTREVVVTVPEYHTDTLYQSKVERDSIWMKDSVVIKTGGDTIMVDRWHVSYKEKVLVDTVYEHAVDTLTKVVEVPVGNASTITKWQKLRMTLGDIALIVMLFIFVFIMFRYVILKVVRP